MERPNNTKSNGVKRYLIAVLTYVFLITNEVEDFFLRFIVHSADTCPRFFAHFSLRLSVHCFHN